MVTIFNKHVKLSWQSMSVEQTEISKKNTSKANLNFD